jgi:polygalacturonase
MLPQGVCVLFQGSGIKITNVSYTDVEGTSATPVAVRFDCSPSQPCTGITMRNVRLSYGKPPQTAESLCRNAHGVAYGQVLPLSCLADQEVLCYK